VGFCRVPSAPAANVLIKGDGVAGTNAATVALGMGAQVTLSTVRLRFCDAFATQFGGRAHDLFDARFDR